MSKCQHGIHAYAIADKSRGIFAEDRCLAQEPVAVMHQKIHDVPLGLGSGDDFKQPEVTGWIKEMRTTEMRLEIIAPSLGHQVDGNARSVGSNQCTGLAMLLHAVKHQLFDIQPLYNHLNYPIC